MVMGWLPFGYIKSPQSQPQFNVNQFVFTHFSICFGVDFTHFSDSYFEYFIVVFNSGKISHKKR